MYFIKRFKKLIRRVVSIIDLRKSVLPGITRIDYYKLKKMRSLKPGAISFFQSKIKFSDNNGFIHSIHEIFSQEVYRFTSANEYPVIIDCGANIGLSVLYFKKLYPKAQILAFEPDPNIYKILEYNISKATPTKNISLRQEAVWTKNEILSFYTDGALAGSSVVDFSSKNNVCHVNAIDLNYFLNREIDFLKIDIEGAENELIFHISKNLKNVKNLFLEYHGLKDQRQNLGDILNLLTTSGFEYYIRVAGETMNYPFCNEEPRIFNQQLNIMCFRKKSRCEMSHNNL